MDELQTYGHRMNMLEKRFRNEADKALQQMVAASVMCFTNVDDCERYGLNDQYHGLLQRPFRDWRNADTWRQRDQLLGVMSEHAIRIVKEHVDCVHSKGKGVIDAEPVGSEGTSFLIQRELVFLHIWQNRREAGRFFHSQRRISQVLFEFKVGSPLHVPVTSIVLHQGVSVSVTWLPPLLSDRAIDVGPSSLINAALERVKNIFHISQLPVYLGADARCYILCVNEVMSHQLSQSGFVENSNEARLEWLQTLKRFPSAPLRVVQTEVLPNAVKCLCSAFDQLDSTETLIAGIIRKGLIPAVLHSYGINLSLLYEVLQSPSLSCATTSSTQLLSQCILTEMIARATLSVLVCVFRSPNVPDYISGDVQSIQRVVVANQSLDRFCKTRSYVNDVLVPVMMKKYGVPAGFSVSAAAFSVRAVLDHLSKHIGVEYDGTGKHIARFVTTFKRCSAFVTPQLVKDVLDVKIAAVSSTVMRNWEQSSRWEEQSLRWLSQRILALHFSFIAHSPMQDDFFREIRASLDFFKESNPAVHCHLLGILAETATSAANLEMLSLAQVRQLKEFEAAEDTPAVAELLRVQAKLLSATKHEDAALSIFDDAVLQFSNTFQMGNRTSSAVHFDLLLFRTLNALRCAGPCTCVQRGFTRDLIQCAHCGLDSKSRKEKVAATLFLLGGIAVETCNTPSMFETLVPCSSAALDLHESLYGPMDNRTAIMNYFHIFCLCESRYDRVQRDPEATAIVAQYRTILNEMFHDDPEPFLNSEWMIGAMGRLIGVAMNEGMWDGAVSVLHCASARYATSGDFVVGNYSLEGPLRRLTKANRCAERIFHYWCRALRNRLNPRVAVFERLHRIGLMIMEQMRRRTICVFKEEHLRSTIALQYLFFVEQVRRSLFFSSEALSRVRQLLINEYLRRSEIRKERSVWMVSTFVSLEAHGRHNFVCLMVAARARAVDYLSMAYRLQLDRQECITFGKMKQQLEEKHRISLMYCEQIARRELYFVAASRVMHRILQNSMILRVVPVLSMYFFSEEQNVRLVIEEEWATGFEEIRLKEQIFRLGVLKREGEKRKSFRARLKSHASEAALAAGLGDRGIPKKAAGHEGPQKEVGIELPPEPPELQTPEDVDLCNITSRSPRSYQGALSASPIRFQQRDLPPPRAQQLLQRRSSKDAPLPKLGNRKPHDEQDGLKYRKVADQPTISRRHAKPSMASPSELQSEIRNLWSSIVTQEHRHKAKSTTNQEQRGGESPTAKPQRLPVL